MKRIFNHRKRPYNDKVDFDEWEGYDEQEEGYEAEAGEGEYYADEVDVEGSYYSTQEGYYDENAAANDYSEEEVSGDGYYQEDMSEEGYYADASEEGSYAEGSYEEDEQEGNYYVDETVTAGTAYAANNQVGAAYYAEDNQSEDAYYSEDEYYDEQYDEQYDEEDWDDEDEKAGFFSGMGIMDRIITCTGAIVLVLALVIGAIYVSGKILDKQVESFATVGSQLESIHLPGEEGIFAIADAQAKKAAQDDNQQSTDTSYNENYYVNDVSVKVTLTSIQKDLKIKFINRRSEKLISNVPFQVTLTNASGASETWMDDDMDGIIYKTDMTPGKYTVTVSELTGDKYKDYSIPSAAQSVEVKKNIEYAKVDVKAEIKSEKDVNVSKEDTKKNETKVETTLKNTVAWVESATIPISYVEVSKDTLVNPVTLLTSALRFQRLAQVPSAEAPSVETPSVQNPSVETPSTENPVPETPSTTPTPETPSAPVITVGISESNKTLLVGESFTLSATAQGVELPSLSWTSSDESIAKITPNGSQVTVEAVNAGTAFVSFSASVVSGNDVTTYSGTCQVTVQAAKGSLSLDKESVALTIGGKNTVKLTTSGFTAGKELVYEVASADASIATVSHDGAGTITVTGVTAGETTITVKVNYKEGNADTAVQASVKVKIVGALALAMDPDNTAVYIGTPVVVNAVLTNALAENPILTAESADTNIATVAVNGKEITITGVNPGVVFIIVRYVENEVAVQATCAVAVKMDPRLDTTNKLKDVNGNTIYVKDGNGYREAFNADYYTAEKFYIKGSAKYTGWQTVNGKIYYFDANGNKVTGQQVIQNAKYNFGSDGALVTGSAKRGIDVSKWNGDIDWSAVKNSGIEYVIIRCGYRGSSQGMLIEDSKFLTNIKGATSAGLKVGVYFFTQAITEAEAVEEASMVLELIDNYNITYPVFLDVEPSGGRADNLSKSARTAICKAFCQTIQANGYKAGIYANKTWLTSKIDASALSSYKIWLAQYTDTPTYTSRYDMWQYQSTGRVSGISGDVDMNWSYLGF